MTQQTCLRHSSSHLAKPLLWKKALHLKVEIVSLGVPHWVNSMEGVGESKLFDATNRPIRPHNPPKWTQPWQPNQPNPTQPPPPNPKTTSPRPPLDLSSTSPRPPFDIPLASHPTKRKHPTLPMQRPDRLVNNAITRRPIDSSPGSLVFGPRSLVLVLGLWSLVLGPWSWSLVFGPWSLVFGRASRVARRLAW